MAGRGTDIKLGGNVDMQLMEALDADPEANPDELRKRIEAEHAEEEKKVLAAGGLYVLATERHESRRIDNQLRGRSGRQGDPGRSSFFLSLEDDLMRIFGSERLDAVLSKLGMKEGEAIIHPWVNKSLEKAQAKVEGAQLRHPQAASQVRRRDERPAQGDLLAAPRDHGIRRPVGRRRGHAPPGGRRPRRRLPAAQVLCRPVGCRRASCRLRREAGARPAGGRLGRPRRASTRRRCASGSTRRPTR